MKNLKTIQKRFNKSVRRYEKMGRRFAAKNPGGLFFSLLAFVTIMVGVNEYMMRGTDQYLAEFNGKMPSAISENIQYAKPTNRTPEKRKLANQAPTAKHR